MHRRTRPVSLPDTAVLVVQAAQETIGALGLWRFVAERPNAASSSGAQFAVGWRPSRLVGRALGYPRVPAIAPQMPTSHIGTHGARAEGHPMGNSPTGDAFSSPDACSPVHRGGRVAHPFGRTSVEYETSDHELGTRAGRKARTLSSAARPHVSSESRWPRAVGPVRAFPDRKHSAAEVVSRFRSLHRRCVKLVAQQRSVRKGCAPVSNLELRTRKGRRNEDA